MKLSQFSSLNSAAKQKSVNFPFKTAIVGVISLAVLLGILFIFLIPPWQHYDEPGHFERVLQTAWSNSRYGDEALTLTLRQEIAASMVEHGFFQNLGFSPNLVDAEEPPWIGYLQSRDMPLYYWIASLPMRFALYQDIEFQLYLGRFVSFLLFLSTLVVSFLLTREITGSQSPLRWLVPLGLVATLPFLDLMTSINNDGIAVLSFSLFLFVGLRILIRGLSVSRAVCLLAATILCLLAKSTVWIAGILGGAAILLAYLLARQITTRRAASGILTAVSLVFVLLFFNFGDAALWYLLEPALGSAGSTRQASQSAPLGRHILSVGGENGLFQPVPADDLPLLRERPATLGAWIWADENGEIRAPYLLTERGALSSVSGGSLTIGSEPAFYAYEIFIPEGTNNLKIILDPLINDGPAGGAIYFDGIVLIPGSWSPESAPTFRHQDGVTGDWGGRTFENLARNASAERAWIVPRHLAAPQTFRLISESAYRSMTGLYDLESFGPVYERAIITLFQSYWGRFGWGQIRLPSLVYWVMLFFTLLSFAGAVLGVRRIWPHRSGQWKVAFLWLVTAAVAVWLQAVLRTGIPAWGTNTFLPAARYAYPVIIPTILFFSSGWLSVFDFLRIRKWGMVSLGLVYLALGLISAVVILNFRQALV